MEAEDQETDNDLGIRGHFPDTLGSFDRGRYGTDEIDRKLLRMRKNKYHTGLLDEEQGCLINLPKGTTSTTDLPIPIGWYNYKRSQYMNILKCPSLMYKYYPR